MGNSEGTSYEKKALRAGDAHSHEDEECRKRPRSARECAEAHSFLFGKANRNPPALITRTRGHQGGYYIYKIL